MIVPDRTGGGISRDIIRAAHGAGAVRRLASDDEDAKRLAYLAIYACGFTHGRDLAPYRGLPALGRNDAFVARLYQTVDDTVWIGGWTVTGHDGQRVLITRDGMRAYVTRGELQPTGLLPGAGDQVAFRAPVLRGGMPGFVFRAGREPLEDRTALSRLYLNIRPSAASWALGALARRLDSEGLAHEMKVLAHPRSYLRRDPCVVYVQISDEPHALDLVARELDKLGRGAVRRGAPRLTGRVVPGLNVAHDPTDLSDGGMSYGQWVASLFLDASQHTLDPPAIAARVRRQIAEAGRDPDRPYRRGDGQRR